MCKKLAREGFNVCIVSRTESKINEKLDEVRRECRAGDGSFQTMAVVADFTKLHTIEDYRTAISEKVKDLDVGVLVLNAGYVQQGPYAELYDSEVERHMTTNILHVAYTTKAMVGQLLERFETKGAKSAIVVVSSIMSTAPYSGLIPYSSSKIFASYFGHALGPELAGKADVIVYEPGGVATKMIRQADGQGDCVTIVPAMSADVCFRDIGIRQLTRGAYRHEVVAWMMEGFPLGPTQAAGAKNASGELAKDRAVQA